jgi:hypothetical protein
MEYFGKEDLIKHGIDSKMSKKILTYCVKSGFVRTKHIKAKDSFRQITKYNLDDFEKSVCLKIKKSKKNKLYLKYVDLWQEYLKIVPELKK